MIEPAKLTAPMIIDTTSATEITGSSAAPPLRKKTTYSTTPIIAAVATQLPRLSRYSVKLQAALDNIHVGQTMWLARPMIDSYHTVWFELHEELILATGRTREADDA